MKSKIEKGKMARLVFALCLFAFAQHCFAQHSAPTRPGASGAQSSPKRPAPAAPAKASAPSRGKAVAAVQPSVGGAVKINGTEYIDLVRYAKAAGYAATWRKKADQLALTKGSKRIEFTGEARDFYVNGIRVFAGFAIRAYRGSLWISRIDADSLLSPIANPAAAGRATARPLRVIAIDAGHGGIDKGKINERLKIYEKTVTLDTARRLKTLLEKQGYKVVMTRNSDVKVDLAKRPAIAALGGADLFISIHYNSVEKGAQTTSGVEVYRYTPRNQASISRSTVTPEDRLPNPGDDHVFWSAAAGFNIHRSLLIDLKATDRGLKHYKFAVLRLAKCPAVLVEAGFLSNNAEARKIATPAHRQKIAEAIARGVKDYAADLAAARK